MPQTEAQRRYNRSPKGKAKIRELRTKARARNREYVIASKDGPCTDCGGRFHHHAMDWDHVGDDKHMAVSTMADGTYSIEAIQQEIDKCELVCANCHRVRTYQRATM